MNNFNIDSVLPWFPNGLSGKLLKRGHIRKNWKERFFVLISNEKTLKYYSDSNMMKLKGEVKLFSPNETIVELISDINFENNKNVFSIRNSNYILYVSASSALFAEYWIRAIQETIHNGFPCIYQPEIWRNSFYPCVEMKCYFNLFNFDDITNNNTSTKSPRRDTKHDDLFMNCNIESTKIDSFISLHDLSIPPCIVFVKPTGHNRKIQSSDIVDIKAAKVTKHSKDNHKQALTQVSSSLYTLVMFDPDLASSQVDKADNKTIKNGFLCWLHVNIEHKPKSANEIDFNLASSVSKEEMNDMKTFCYSNGCDIVPYNSPCPVFGMKWHRIFILLFRQSTLYDDAQINLFKGYFRTRFQFNLQLLVSILKLGDNKVNPSAICRYYCKWENIPVDHNDLSYKIGNIDNVYRLMY